MRFPRNSPPGVVGEGDARSREGRLRPGWRGKRGAKPSGRTRCRTVRTCSGSGSCGLLSGVLLPPATPRTGEPAEESAWPGAGAVGNPSSVSDRLFSWSISLGGERSTVSSQHRGPRPAPPPPLPAQPRVRPPAGSGPPGPARGPSSGGGTRRDWDVTPLAPGESRCARESRAGPACPHRGAAHAWLRSRLRSEQLISDVAAAPQLRPFRIYTHTHTAFCHPAGPVPVGEGSPARPVSLSRPVGAPGAPRRRSGPRRSAAAEPGGINRRSAGLRDKRAPLKLGRRLGKANKDKA